MMNILNGGKHADNNVDFQEFMIQPWGFETFSEALRAGVEIYHALKGVLKKQGLNASVGDEGGFAPSLKANEDALKVIEEAVGKAGYKWGEQIFVALDPATSELWNEAAKLGKKGYCFFKSNPKEVLSSEDMISIWKDWIKKYPIRSIEDGLAENDWDGWKKFTDAAGDKVQLVGDDLFVTNVKFLSKGIKTKTANAILVKVNQIGTLVGNLRGRRPGDAQRLQRRALAPLGRNRRRHDFGHRGGHQLRPNQDRRPGPLGPGGEVQPADPHRRTARRTGCVWQPGSGISKNFGIRI